MIVSVGARAVEWSLAERERFPGGKPPAARIAEYFAPAKRNGALLGLTAGNWCAAGACYAIAQVLGTNELDQVVPHGYRVSGLELEDDARKRELWLPATLGRPALGDLAIFNRGAPTDWTKHVGRVSRVDGDGFETIDANGTGAAWSLSEHKWNQATLRGFVRYPSALPSSSSSASGRSSGGWLGLLLLFALSDRR